MATTIRTDHVTGGKLVHGSFAPWTYYFLTIVTGVVYLSHVSSLRPPCILGIMLHPQLVQFCSLIHNTCGKAR